MFQTSTLLSSLHVDGVNIFPRVLQNNIFLLFSTIITKEKLYAAALFFFVITLIIVIATFSFLVNKEKAFFYKEWVQNRLRFWIGKTILANLDETAIMLPDTPKFKKIINDPVAQQHIIDELVITKKNLKGKAAQNIISLYLLLNLKAVSIKKLESNNWQKKVLGIQELYIMEQRDMLLKIYRYSNSINEFIRIEAQTAIVHLIGFKGLRFLNIIDTPISNWQQLKLLDSLPAPASDAGKDLCRWLESDNCSVVVFTLRVIEKYQLFEHYDCVLKCMEQESEAIRIQAIRTLTAIANSNTGAVLIKAFENESPSVKMNILDHLAAVASKDHLSFLIDLQNQSDEQIMFKAAKVLASSSPVGIALLEIMAKKDPEHYQNIFLHVKNEMGE